jgi:hypothetical protein
LVLPVLLNAVLINQMPAILEELSQSAFNNAMVKDENIDSIVDEMQIDTKIKFSDYDDDAGLLAEMEAAASLN